jgi:hypothetical protein
MTKKQEQTALLTQNPEKKNNLLLASQAQGISQAAQTQTVDQLVESKTTKDAIQETTQTKTVEQTANQGEHTVQQETNSSDDLEQWLGEQSPQRVQLLLGMRHVGNALLAVVYGLHHGLGQLLDHISQLVFFGCRIACRGASLGGSSDTTIRIESTDGAIALLQEAATFFDQRLDVLDQLLFIKLVLGSAVCLLEALYKG